MGILYNLDKGKIIDENSTVEDILYGIQDKVLIECYTDETSQTCIKPIIEKLQAEYNKYFAMDIKIGKLFEKCDGTYEFKQDDKTECARGTEIYELPTLIISNKTEEIFIEGVQEYSVYVNCIKRLNKVGTDS